VNNQQSQINQPKKPDYTLAKNVLYKGFITGAVEITLPDSRTMTIVLKSLNSNEHDIIKLSAASSKKGESKMRGTILTLLYATFLVDGENVLANRTKYFSELTKTYGTLKPVELFKIIAEVSRINQRFIQEQDNVYRYMHSPDSRVGWSVCKTDVTQSRFTGIEGTDILGFNEYQKLWAVFNQNEDMTIYHKSAYNLVLFLASAIDPKSVNAIRAQQDAEEKYEEERRKRLVEGADLDKPFERVGIKTVEQLKREMEMAVRGEKDFHDMVIEDFERQLRDKIKVRFKNELARKEHLASQGSGFLVSASRVLTPEEAQQAMTQRPATTVPVDIDYKQQKEMSDDLKVLRPGYGTQVEQEARREVYQESAKPGPKIPPLPERSSAVFGNQNRSDPELEEGSQPPLQPGQPLPSSGQPITQSSLGNQGPAPTDGFVASSSKVLDQKVGQATVGGIVPPRRSVRTPNQIRNRG